MEGKMDDIILLLASWAIPEEVIEAFRSNGITIDDLDQLSQEHIKEICPHILGNRLKLTKKINEYLESKASTVSVTTFDSDSVASVGTLIAEENGDLSIALSDLFPSTSVNQSFPDFDLKTLLETSPTGKSILNFYATNNKLDTKRKNRLTDIIIRHLFTFIINKRLTYDDYNVLTGKIITLFPKECPGTYFTRPVRKSLSGSGKSIAARGKLVDKVRNFLFQSNETKRGAELENNPAKKLKTNDILLSIHEDDITWLNNNYEPWSEIKSKWHKTAQIRHELEYNDVHDFITKWKVLQIPAAAELINDDFAILYPDKKNRFRECWKIFMQKLIELKKEEINSDEHKKDLLISINSNDTEDTLPTELTLLANIAPPKGRVSKTGKFSTQECLDSIMIIVENPGDIDSVLQKQIDRAAKRKLQVQPYVILLGTLQKVHQAYIVIDKIRYTFASVTEAFDLLFKSYHVLNARYPKPSDHIHLIIQQCVYNIYTKFDNPVPYIADILAINIKLFAIIPDSPIKH